MKIKKKRGKVRKEKKRETEKERKTLDLSNLENERKWRGIETKVAVPSQDRNAHRRDRFSR